MPLHRNNDEERAAVVERLIQQDRRDRARRQAKATLSDGDRGSAAPDRRRAGTGRDLKRELAELERQWRQRQRRRQGKKKNAS